MEIKNKEKEGKRVMMPRLKNFLPNMFGSSSKKDATKLETARLETDALPVFDADDANNGNRRNSPNGQQSTASTPTASAELTEYVVRELSDPNYNSLEVAELPTNGGSGGSGGALATIANGQLAASAPADNNTTMNTMNVHNAQQQLVMQFSNVNKLHIGSVLNFNTNLSASNASKGGAGICASEEAACSPFPNGGASAAAGTSKRQTTRKTTSIVGMMQSQEEPNHRMLDTIATHLGEGWKEVMRKLGHSEGQIDQAVIDHQMHGGIREVIYQLLLQWVRNADDGFGTLGHITSLLWESNHRDCVQRMKLVWKAEVNRKTSR